MPTYQHINSVVFVLKPQKMTKIEGEIKGVFDNPLKKTIKKKRAKLKKERLHIYLTSESVERTDEKAEEMGLNRSTCIQVLINFGLNNLKTIPTNS